MPLFYQHNINHTAKLAVWRITETEDFFLEKVSLKRIIPHPNKRLQHLAGRYLLQLLHPEFPLDLIEIAESNKPLLPYELLHFSISHCRNFAAAIVSEKASVGIDVELITQKVELIQHKFLSTNELRLIHNVSSEFLTLLWSCKEAVYKWYGKNGVDFKNHINIKRISVENDHGIIKCIFNKEKAIHLNVNFHFFENITLAWVTE